ncbi:MAG: hypothetical protein IPI98_00255 [Chitinophagaceae bacterium]|nr:hypothetical protein [Chitinophagaceae bacterium]
MDHKEVLQHLIDCERIFTYRALCFARKNNRIYFHLKKIIMRQTVWPMQGTGELCDEFNAVRRSTLLLFKGFQATA